MLWKERPRNRGIFGMSGKYGRPRDINFYIRYFLYCPFLSPVSEKYEAAIFLPEHENKVLYFRALCTAPFCTDHGMQ